MTAFAVTPPKWFWAAAALIVLWGVVGVTSFYSDLTMNADSIAGMDDYDRQLYLSRPSWLNIVYGLATWGGLLGGVALLMRRRIAFALFVVSLAAVLAQFGWAFGATDLIAVKGAGTTVLPIVILIIAIFQIWFALAAARRGWLR